MYGLSVLFELRDESAAAGFDELVAETLPLVKVREPGTLVYAVHRVAGSPLQRVFYELYVDEAAFEEHEASEYTKRFLAAREQYLTNVRVERLELVDGKGVESGG